KVKAPKKKAAAPRKKPAGPGLGELILKVVRECKETSLIRIKKEKWGRCGQAQLPDQDVYQEVPGERLPGSGQGPGRLRLLQTRSDSRQDRSGKEGESSSYRQASGREVTTAYRKKSPAKKPGSGKAALPKKKRVSKEAPKKKIPVEKVEKAKSPKALKTPQQIG
ncbi:hypothetical protein chiPu_0024889, partial [Chiloscyllium punctatum]|nr:hypothetical protein [Chiloscyllium punctatum]